MIATPTGRENNSDVQSRSLDLFDVIRRQWSKVFTGILLGVVIASAYCYFAPAIYESTAEILVLGKDTDLARRSGSVPNESMGLESVIESEILATHLHILKSPRIVRRALEESELFDRQSLLQELDTISLDDEGVLEREVSNYVMTNLEVERGGDAETKGAQVLRVSFRHSHAEDGAEVLNAVIQTYQTFIRETLQGVGGEAVSLIQQARTDLEQQVQVYDKEYADFMRQSPLNSQAGEVVNPHTARLVELEAERSRLQIERAKAQSRLALVQRAMAKDDEIKMDDLFMIDSSDVPRLNLLLEIDRNAPSAAVTNEYVRVRQLNTEVASLSQRLGKNHPKVRESAALLRESEAANSDMKALLAVTQDEGINPLRIANGYADLLRNDLNELEHSLDALQTLIKGEKDAARVLVDTELQQQRHRRQLERAESLYDTVVDRIGELDILSNYAGFTNEILKPVEPGAQVWPSIPLLVLAGMVLGGVMGCGWAFLAEVTDKSFRTPVEIEDALRLPVVSHIPAIRGIRRARHKIHAGIVMEHQSKSDAAEEFRRLRASLLYKVRTTEHPIIQVTSPGDIDGKSIVAGNLAAAIAHGQKRVLLIDANLDRPRLDDLLSNQNAYGITDFVAGRLEDECVHASRIANLDVMPCGTRRDQTSEQFLQPAYRELLSGLRERYDLVIVDSPGILTASHALTIAELSDYVLVTMSLQPNSRPHLHESIGFLRQIGCNSVGLIVNEYPYAKGYHRIGFVSGFQSTPASMAPEYAINRLELASNG